MGQSVSQVHSRQRMRSGSAPGPEKTRAKGEAVRRAMRHRKTGRKSKESRFGATRGLVAAVIRLGF